VKKAVLLSFLFLALFAAHNSMAQDMTPMPDGQETPPVSPAPVPVVSANPLPPAPAASPPAPVVKNSETPFTKFDKNNDGEITYEEFSPLYSALYEQNDPADAGQQFALMDKDGNNRVTQKEFQANFGGPVDDNYTVKWVPNGTHGAND
jgi:hypothetical protein